MIDIMETGKQELRYIRMPAAARLLGVQPTTLRAYARRNGLRRYHIPMDRGVFFKLEDIKRLQQERGRIQEDVD